MHFYPFHIGDYRSSTAHLTNEEDLVYRRLIDMYYDTELPIPLDTQRVARRLRVSHEVVVDVLKEFFQESENGWNHHRCDEEIQKYKALSQRNRANGRLGGRPKSKAKEEKPALTQSEPSGNPVGTQWEPSANPALTQWKPSANPALTQWKPSANPVGTQWEPSGNPVGTQWEPSGNPVGTQSEPSRNPLESQPRTKNHELINTKKNITKKNIVPDGVSDGVWADFVQHRKKKKAPITETVIKRIQSEAGKAGISLDEALTEVCMRGWTGFRAEWLDKNKKPLAQHSEPWEKPGYYGQSGKL